MKFNNMNYIYMATVIENLKFLYAYKLASDYDISYEYF